MIFWEERNWVDMEIVLNGVHKMIVLSLCETPVYLVMDGGIAIDPLMVTKLQEAADKTTGPEFSRCS